MPTESNSDWGIVRTQLIEKCKFIRIASFKWNRIAAKRIFSILSLQILEIGAARQKLSETSKVLPAKEGSSNGSLRVFIHMPGIVVEIGCSRALALVDE